MKKLSFIQLITLLLCIAAVFSLTGCGSKANKTQQQQAAPSKSTEPDAPMTAQNAQAETMNTGFVFIHNGVRIGVDAEASSIVRALGEPISYFEAASCVFEGLDKMYTYGGFELDTYPTDGKDFVSAVIFRDDSVTTPEGVMIGDGTEKLHQVYGAPSSEADNLMVYEAGSMELRFILEDDAIAAIEYISLAVS